jgi:dephospho-CoA kinase
MIELVSYDSTWPARFAEEATRLWSACGNGVLRIDHVGSTSIPGLAAKPIIDGQMTVSTVGSAGG